MSANRCWPGRTNILRTAVFTLLFLVILFATARALPAAPAASASGPHPESVLSASWWHTCALQIDGQIHCWGDEFSGTQAGTFVQVAAGVSHNCGLRPDGSVDCWGDNEGGRAEDQPGPYVQVSAGLDHSCALRPDGSIDCWGDNWAGQAEDQPGPYLQVSNGRSHTCGLRADGSLHCWGYDTQDEAGPFTQISTGYVHVCALRPDGSAACFGDNSDGQAEDRTGPFTQISARVDTNCGLKADGSVECWGYGDYGQTAPQTGPYVQISAGSIHACGLTPAGAVECWGGNSQGQGGTQPGPYGRYAALPSPLSRVSTGAAGQANDHSWDPAISADGQFVAFASNAYNLDKSGATGEHFLYLKNLDTGAFNYLISLQDDTYTHNPALSSDGRYVAFESDMRGGGGPPTVLIWDSQEQKQTDLMRSTDPDANAYYPAISNDGRYVAFESDAPDLVPDDTNGKRDIFLYDQQTKSLALISEGRNALGAPIPANGHSRRAALSGDGRFVVFESGASNLVPGLTYCDIVLIDRQTGDRSCATAELQEASAYSGSSTPAISADGSTAAFVTAYPTADGQSYVTVIYTYDRLSGATTLTGTAASVNLDPALSADGRFLAFSAYPWADETYTPGRKDIFLHDRASGQTRLVSAALNGAAANSDSAGPAISGDGRYVTFASAASNLVPDDTNGKQDIFLFDSGVVLNQMAQVLSAGGEHTCALQPNGAVLCWGAIETTARAALAGPLTAVEDGADHACGLTPEGAAVCWGDNSYGQAEGRDGPFRQISAGNVYNCGLLPNGSVDCWAGDNDWGEVEDQPGPYTHIAAGTNHVCGIKPDGTLSCWGTNKYGQGNYPAGTFRQLSAGWDHTCGLTIAGGIVCWGKNEDGQTIAPAGLFQQVAAGSFHSCALRLDGSADCWGRNDRGQAADQPGPFSALSAGGAHTCGLRPDGSVFCWGDNAMGQAAEQPGPFGPYDPALPPEETLWLPFITGSQP